MSDGRGKKPLVPRLRFPEFRDAGPWEVKRLGEIGENHDSRRIPIPAKDRAKGDIPYYGASGIIDYIKDYIFDGDFLCISEDGANLVARTYPIAFSVSGKSWVNNHAHVLSFEKICTQILVENYLNFTNIEDYLTGMAQPKLNRAKLDIIPIPLPDPSEQQKIADCLSYLDELIELEARQCEALKQHKKGLMQQLFPREGETTPCLRFPEFRDAGPWEVKRLGDIVKITGGGTPSKAKENFWRGHIPWVSSSDISEDSILRISVTRFITKEAIKQSATKLIPKNSILLVSRVGVGKLAVSTEPICTSQDFTNLTPFNDDVLFLAYYLKSLSYVFASFNQGMAIKGFTKEDVASLNIGLPDAVSGEQQKIADCFFSLDELIELQSQKVETLKQHKKGLMQQLFPQEVA